MGGGKTSIERVWWEALNGSGNTSGWVVGLGGIGGDERNRQWKGAGGDKWDRPGERKSRAHMEQVVRGTLSDGGRGIDKLGSGVGLEWGWVPSEVPVGSRFEVPRRAQKAAGAAWFLSVRRGRVAFPQVRCSPLKDWRRFRIDAE